uniref:B30.2/SPRY domain-containing protein n=1 Tax=Gopherus agassizii TaxID=38772 RepID=A0A452ICQ9_9SAUR
MRSELLQRILTWVLAGESCPHAHGLTDCHIWGQEGIFLQGRLTEALEVFPNVTLDPNTANAQLIVSEDRKSVRRGIARQEVPDNPERFHSFCLLDCERFTSGRHYWEVEVGDGGFWAVGVRCGDQYRALTSPETPMPLSERPKKIGVYLDYEAEWVAFYDTGNETLIFTFMSASFTGETILPFFWVGIGVLLRQYPTGVHSGCGPEID